MLLCVLRPFCMVDAPTQVQIDEAVLVAVGGTRVDAPSTSATPLYRCVTDRGETREVRFLAQDRAHEHGWCVLHAFFTRLFDLNPPMILRHRGEIRLHRWVRNGP